MKTKTIEAELCLLAVFLGSCNFRPRVPNVSTTEPGPGKVAESPVLILNRLRAAGVEVLYANFGGVEGFFLTESRESVVVNGEPKEVNVGPLCLNTLNAETITDNTPTAYGGYKVVGFRSGETEYYFGPDPVAGGKRIKLTAVFECTPKNLASYESNLKSGDQELE